MNSQPVYPKGSAGRLMISTVPIFKIGTKVSEVSLSIQKSGSGFSTINYIYLVDKENILRGVLSIQDLYQLSDSDLLAVPKNQKLVFVRPHTDQERVAQLALKYSIKAVPVVFKDGKLLGVVDSDTILAVLNQEHTEDVFRFAGVHQRGKVDNATLLFNASSVVHIKSRLPWLIIGLLGGVGAAMVVGKFESTLEEQLILAAFIPAIVYMADAVGSQTQMLFVRALSIDTNLKLGSYIGREIRVNFFIGLILAGLIFLISWFWLGDFSVSLILSVSIFLTVWSTILIAIMLPWLIIKIGQDPAVASGPLATVIRDVMSLCIYLLVATSFLG